MNECDHSRFTPHVAMVAVKLPDGMKQVAEGSNFVSLPSYDDQWTGYHNMMGAMPAFCRLPATWLMVGQKRMGKSTVICNNIMLLTGTHPLIKTPCVLDDIMLLAPAGVKRDEDDVKGDSKLKLTLERVRKMRPEVKIETMSEFKPDMLRRMLEDKTMMERRVGVFLDDASVSNMNGKVAKWLLTMARHLKIFLMMVLHDWMMVQRQLRGLFDVASIHGELPDERALQKFSEFCGMKPNLVEKVLKFALKEPFPWLMVDKSKSKEKQFMLRLDKCIEVDGEGNCTMSDVDRPTAAVLKQMDVNEKMADKMMKKEVEEVERRQQEEEGREGVLMKAKKLVERRHKNKGGDLTAWQEVQIEDEGKSVLGLHQISDTMRLEQVQRLENWGTPSDRKQERKRKGRDEDVRADMMKRLKSIKKHR